MSSMAAEKFHAILYRYTCIRNKIFFLSVKKLNLNNSENVSWIFFCDLFNSIFSLFILELLLYHLCLYIKISSIKFLCHLSLYFPFYVISAICILWIFYSFFTFLLLHFWFPRTVICWMLFFKYESLLILLMIFSLTSPRTWSFFSPSIVFGVSIFKTLKFSCLCLPHYIVSSYVYCSFILGIEHLTAYSNTYDHMWRLGAFAFVEGNSSGLSVKKPCCHMINFDSSGWSDSLLERHPYTS